ncbi:hypothetical protein L210DRAFT_3529314 [Boletus edulis BED1]|uniref:B-block binding subunit of TFIIIC domain-containing protein n=1 Tax=Boletus edulis BED1 TaxID=1328754 RepID=A0AAD4GIV0_BOLED|nr:hypothetical protein L210DRAFT_3529314 [Boletus edulis BED1]
MDELVHHCIRELSFDGDLGCNVSRLRDFITGFYTSQDDHSQLVDDAFCAFVWSLVVQQPSVRVGTLPPGTISQVYIAPQTSAKRKAAAKGEQVIEDVPTSLELVEDARHRHLEDLKHQYGDGLRIAVDPGTSFAAITGSHIRPPKLSPMVYSALQLITRGRVDGITTVELGRKTKYDQKTCFYLIKQLVELGLIIKARRGGVGNHTCIHKYFVERSPLWQQIQEEEARDDEPITDERVKLSDTTDEVTDLDGPLHVLFDPIDSRHLSSLPLVKNRIIKLLKASRNHIHQSNNLLMTIGFVHPTKTDRRFFQTRLRELIQQGVIERVLVPSSKTRDRRIKCIRLVTSDSKLPDGSVVVRQDAEEDERDASLIEDASVGHNEVKTNVTIHKQVSNMLEEAGPSGLTLNEICISLGNFDKRTIELLLTRASNNKPPAHLGDFGTIDLMETYGRERRHRYFTLAAYKCLMSSERLQDTTTSIIDVDLSQVGDFAASDPKHFYTTTVKLHAYQDSFKDIATAKGKKRKRDEEGGDGEKSESAPKRKRGRPRKTPALPDASAIPPKKRGRPRKNPAAKDGEAQTAATAGSPSKPMVEVNAVGEGQTVAGVPPTTGQAVVNSCLSNEASLDAVSRSVPFEQDAMLPLSVGNSVKSAFVTPADRPERCDVVAGISHPGSEKGGGDVQSYRSTKTPSRCSSKRARTVVPAMDHYSIAVPENNATVSSGSQSSGRDGPRRKLAASVAQEEEPILVPAGQESSQTPSCDIGICEKHKDANLPPSSRPLKRSRTNGDGKSRSSINISSLRRENELFKVIESMGGIANMHSKEIFDAHTVLLETMSQAKEPTSAPVGTRLDKRTAESTLKNLENRGRIKMLKTSLVSSSGASRPACLVYLPDTPQETLNAYLRQISQSVPSTTVGLVKVLDEGIEYGPGVSSARHVSLEDKRKAKEAQNIESRSVLGKKAEEARAQREQDWDDLLRRFHPEPMKGTLAVRVRAVQSRFMQSAITKDQRHWENEIREAVKETQLVSKKITSQPKSKLGVDVRTPITGPPPLAPNPPEKSLELLITQQGPPITPTASVKKKGKAKKESEDLASRRPRFHWTREFDELARDASAIIRARCRASRLDLSAFDQVFPAVPRNSVRQRMTHLRDNAAEDLYMKRLEDQWHTVWLQYRGTPHLPDEVPDSPSNFNLISHIEFLRKHVDKNALRVGFVEREAQSKLPASIKELHSFYEVGEDVVSAPAWDFMWGMTVEEGREKQFRSLAFTREPDNMFEDAKPEKIQLAEAALKMVFGTPSELYDSDSATRLLRSAGDQCVSLARSNLLHQGVLSKVVRDPKKPKPGRMLKISDANLGDLGGPFPRDMFQDAISLEELAIERVVDEMEWSLTASEGDIATLLQLVSEDQVDFTVDLSQSRAVRQKIDWNSKRADDEDIETSIRLRFSRTSVVGPGGNQDQCPESPVVEPDANTSTQEIHGTTLDGKAAACTLKTTCGLINCSACIDTAFRIFTSSLSQSDRDLACRILDYVRSLKESGLKKETCLGLEAGLEQHILWLVHRMTLTSPPILMWTYFNTPLLVAGDYCSVWSVVVFNEPLTLVTPRRWLDIRGYRLDGPWRAAQQAVTGVIFLHPGISQAELRWRLRAVYDRQEIVDLLSSLQEDGVLECRVDESAETVQSLPGWLKTVDNDEMVFWFIAKNHHWYQL